MTVEELFYFLEENLDNGTIDLETQVMFASQPHYPLVSSIDDVQYVDGVVYLAEDHKEDYLPEEVREALNW